MAKGKALPFFLGANTPKGFYSLYDQYVSTQRGDFLYVLKGGPGCGKSSFMRRIAEGALDSGLDVEYILCSGDPDSLDGVFIPEKRIAYVDGTAPHVLEPDCCGAAGAYLDLSRYLDTAALQHKLPELLDLQRRYKAKYAHAYTLLRALPSFSPEALDGLLTEDDYAAAAHRAESAANRMPRAKNTHAGKTHTRFLRAFSAKGETFCTETVRALCDKVYLLDDRLGLADTYLKALMSAAQKRRHALILCPDPLAPERLEAVLLPELRLGYIAERTVGLEGLPAARHIRLDKIPDETRTSAFRARLRALTRQRAELLSQAQLSLAQAKTLHDALEAQYNPHVNFAGVLAEAKTHVQRIIR